LPVCRRGVAGRWRAALAGKSSAAIFIHAQEDGMKRMVSWIAMSIVAVAVSPAMAAGQYDGNWYVDAAPAAQTSSSDVPAGCDAVRLPFMVTDNKITGSLQRAPYGTGRVEEGSGSSASPITGTVQPDGTFVANWQNYHGTGKLSGDHAELKWNGECGPRTATGGRAK
jgi:hypothetical protein